MASSNVPFDSAAMGERLRKLREIHGYGLAEAAKMIGIDKLTLTHFEEGIKKEVFFGILVKIAKFYNCSVDYILGLTELPEEQYRKDISELHEKAYEKYLVSRPFRGYEFQTERTYKTVVSPYPYNLLEAVFTTDFDDLPLPLNTEQKRCIEEQVDLLTPRERETVRYYFSQNKTLEEIGEIYLVGRERTRQVLARAIRKLRYRAFLGEIKRWAYPEEYKKLLGLREEKKKIDEELTQLGDVIFRMKEAVSNLEKADEEGFAEAAKEVVQETSNSPLRTPLMDLDLSVRSFNGLARFFGYPRALVRIKNGRAIKCVQHPFATKSCKEVTADDICKLYTTECNENGRPWIYNVRNLGKKCICEITNKLVCIGCDSVYPVLTEISEA